MMSMFILSLSTFDDNLQIPAPILVFARLSSFSNAHGNVLATVYTIDIYVLSMFLVAIMQTTQERETGRFYFCRQSTLRGGSYEIRKARLQILAAATKRSGRNQFR